MTLQNLPPIDSLLRACDELPGSVCGIASSVYMRALVLTCHATGMRMSEARELRWSMIAADGRVSLTAPKTGWTLKYRLDAQAMEALKAIREASQTDHVFPGSKASHLRLWRLLARFAGVTGRLPFAIRKQRFAKGGAA